MGNGGKSWKGVERGGAHKLAEEEREGFLCFFLGKVVMLCAVSVRGFFSDCGRGWVGRRTTTTTTTTTHRRSNFFLPSPSFFCPFTTIFAGERPAGEKRGKLTFLPLLLFVSFRDCTLSCFPFGSQVPTTPLEYERAKRWRRRLRRRKRDLSPPHSLVSIYPFSSSLLPLSNN